MLDGDIEAKNFNGSPDDSSKTSPEIKRPASFIFGEIEIQEETEEDLIGTGEKEIYRQGFDRYKKLVESSKKDQIMQEMLLSPRIASVIIGIQPERSLYPEETSLLLSAFRRAGIDINAECIVLHFPGSFTDNEGNVYTDGDEMWSIINYKAAIRVFQKYHEELGIDLPLDSPFTREQLTNDVINLFQTKNRSKNFALGIGLLSGYPLQDCVDYSREYNQMIFPSIEIPSSLDTLPIEEQATQYLEEKGVGVYYVLDAYYDYMGESLLPDKRKKIHPQEMTQEVSGYGLTWVTKKPVSVETRRYCQKLIQVDQELGLSEYVNLRKEAINKQKDAEFKASLT